MGAIVSSVGKQTDLRSVMCTGRNCFKGLSAVVCSSGACVNRSLCT